MTNLDKTSLQPRTGRFLVNAAAFVIVVAGMKAASSIIVPFLLAVFIAINCLAPFLWLRKKRVPRPLALLLVILCVLVIGFLVAALIGSSLSDFSSSLPEYQALLKAKAGVMITWLERIGFDFPDQAVMDSFDPGMAMGFVGSFLSGLGGVLSYTFLIALLIIFILAEASGFPAKLEAASKDSKASLGQMNAVIDNIKRYMAIKTVISFGTGAAITIWLSILGVDYALLWGLLAFLLNYVPNIGSILAAIPAVLLALISGGIGVTLLTAAGYLGVNLIAGTLIEPRVMGKGLGLSTLVVFLSLVFWGWVLGPVGMLLSVPLSMTVKIALDSHDDTRWLAIMLGSGKVK
ncbi:hypothetical protein CEE37_15030 [candidate division LCP-89 bacterium B3_LCP]|uniref:AI-2E family transporter n=1 Tax=candidate division LCP-89 bacterium B3_LCP TaxID=2012998 RepID=A0A532UNS4_UNCL8|nr:MAG: hypothetical protein CEE37_15030 [candidate division LCP-89 bacterium B3_LCP]